MSPKKSSAEKRLKRAAQILRIPGTRTLARELSGGGSFELTYTRTGPHGALPVLLFPGGPGLASVLPYRGLRAKAEKLGLDLIMIEHRGVGLSRTDTAGRDLSRSEITVDAVLDDARAVLEAEGIDRAVVYGSSYGSYLAQGFGVRHPDRVAAMVLDSAMLTARDMEVSRALLRQLFWEGTPETRRATDLLRTLVDDGVLDAAQIGFPVQFLYEFGGTPLVVRALGLLARGKGRRTWQWISGLGEGEIMMPRPFMMEFDLVGEIAFRELDYGVRSDGQPLDNASSFTEAAAAFSPFESEPFALRDHLPAFGWPTVVISGERDIRTPRAIAEEIVDLVPDGHLVPVCNHAHSALDSQQEIALGVLASVAGRLGHAATAADHVVGVPLVGRTPLMGRIVATRLRLAGVVPRPL